MSTSIAAERPADATDVVETVARLRRTAEAAGRWLVDRIDSSGKPAGADIANVWWRVPWALTLLGERDAAAAMLSWIEREALDDQGDLRPGPARGSGPVSPVYSLSHISIAAFLLNRYDTARLVYAKVASFQHPTGGGVLRYRDGRGEEQDLLLTTQLGLLAVIAGDLDVAGRVYNGIRTMWQLQPELGRLRLYSNWSPGGLITEFPAAEAWSKFADFNAPRQAFYHPGAVAAFFADYAMRTGDREAIALARDMMQLNIGGCDEQFTDLSSVQICKFGWGAAQLLIADPHGGWLAHALRMAEWFIDRQEADGSWIPSTFQLTKPAGDMDKMWKTAEHLMESCLLGAALAGSDRPGRIGSRLEP